jgi:hypothetical protein
MPKKKVLGISVDYRDIVNFNVKLLVGYQTISNEKIKKEAIFSIQTTDKETARLLAIEKCKKQLEEFSYIIKNSVTIEVKGRNKNGKN